MYVAEEGEEGEGEEGGRGTEELPRVGRNGEGEEDKGIPKEEVSVEEVGVRAVAVAESLGEEANEAPDGAHCSCPTYRSCVEPAGGRDV